MSPGAPLLEVREMSVAYGKVAAVVNARLEVKQGQIVTVIGPNGAGKTTLLAAIIGALPANGSARGAIQFSGEATDAAETSIERMVARGMTLVPERRELFGEMSVADNLLLGAFQRYRSGQRDHTQTMDEVFTLFPRLRDRRSQLAGTLSGGERQMLAVGRALMAKP
ncbi:MAG: ATP-binding cassette domain-containing protein, partial [Pseudomonadota bacterium]|nr:ATP-binding cassette domain-containing protein [Pseudomonadota bacterium]